MRLTKGISRRIWGAGLLAEKCLLGLLAAMIRNDGIRLRIARRYWLLSRAGTGLLTGDGEYLFAQPVLSAKKFARAAWRGLFYARNRAWSWALFTEGIFWCYLAAILPEGKAPPLSRKRRRPFLSCRKRTRGLT